ncbi:MAG: hypothetical protein GXP55_11925, partial [Deltaproteobacteria bacterium]|nr:hypothetical protein [Deltaproteobacteria bacterium]
LVLTLAGCARDVGSSNVARDLTLDEVQRGSVVAGFEDAVAYCEARLLGKHNLKVTQAQQLGDVSLEQFVTPLARPTGIRGGPHAGPLPDRDRDPSHNACQASVSLTRGAHVIDPGLEDGFCRADFNYCIGQELLLRAEAPGAPVDLVSGGLYHRARERLAAAALEYVTALAWYARHCDREPDVLHRFECGRLTGAPGVSAGYAAVAEARLADAVSRMAATAGKESSVWVAEAESVASDVDSFDPARSIDRVWGPEGGRTRAAETGYGPVGGTLFDATPNARRSADVPLPLALSTDERATLALSLMARYDVPIGLYGLDAPFLPPQPAFLLATWTSPVLLASTFNLLDHRIAAEAYEPPYLANPLAPDFAAGEALRQRRVLSLAEFLSYQDNAISPELSPLFQRFGLTQQDLSDALKLFADAIEVKGVDYMRKPSVSFSMLALYSARITDAASVLPIHTLAASLADDGVSAGPDPLALLMPPLPRDGGATSVDNWYEPSISLVDGSQRVVVAANPSAPLGLSGALSLLRVHMARLRSMGGSFIDPEPLSEAVAIVDSTLGASWSEFDTRTDPSAAPSTVLLRLTFPPSSSPFPEPGPAPRDRPMATRSTPA